MEGFYLSFFTLDKILEVRLYLHAFMSIKNSNPVFLLGQKEIYESNLYKDPTLKDLTYMVSLY